MLRATKHTGSCPPPTQSLCSPSLRSPSWGATKSLQQPIGYMRTLLSSESFREGNRHALTPETGNRKAWGGGKAGVWRVLVSICFKEKSFPEEVKAARNLLVNAFNRYSIRNPEQECLQVF